MILLLGAAWTGFGKVGSALPPGPSAYERTRQMIHTKYLEGKKNTSPDAILRTDTVAWILCKGVGELCSEDLSAPTDQSSLLYQAGWLIAMPYSQPAASGVAWLGDTLEHMGFVPKSYAQGMGFSALGSYREVWKVMRDIAFLLVTLMIVVSGFIIIFGIKIGEKAGVAIEEMLPRLVVVLIMISLSYAIVGFMIDLMYVLMFLAYSVMAPILHLSASAQNQALVSIASGGQNSLWNLMNSQTASPFTYTETARALFQLLPGAAQFVVSGIFSQIGLPFLAGIVGGLFPAGKIADTIKGVAKSFPAAKIANGLAGKEVIAQQADTKLTGVATVLSIVMLIISVIESIGAPFITPLIIAGFLFVTTIYLFFKVWFMLFNCYMEIVVGTIFAPIFIMLHALPGSKSIYTWFKSIAINLLVFPAVLVLMMIAAFVANANGERTFFDTSKNFWAPPFLNSLGSQTALQTVMGGLIFYNIPVFITQLKKSLGYEEGMFSKIGLSSFAAPAIGFVTSAFGTVNTVAGFAERINKSGVGNVLTKRE